MSGINETKHTNFLDVKLMFSPDCEVCKYVQTSVLLNYMYAMVLL